MKLSSRLSSIVNMIPKCNCLSDIGTDHGFIPIYTVLNDICERAIASDIKEGPLKTAKKNIEYYGLQEKIELRKGSGLKVLKKGEADVIVIAGMGGYTISSLIDEGIEIAKSAEHIIFQPAKYPEVLRKYLLSSGFKIYDEELVKEDNKYYHIIRASEGIMNTYEREADYYIGLKLIEKRHPLLKDYIDFKIEEFNKILKELSIENQNSRYIEVKNLIKEFEDVIKCL
ncbi:tRNA (adenine22-N1)-methyltransferase [Caloramator quimbayensis]|uniref:tRNA (Adenine22-N1)-methyltransferase n=1 Tax=Caloramator quimbayensis TaxID=1147123 RepID=A0A1T4XAX2_9CLOT|nr:class I SAM-dependent methyltransferase [Caloramator quimbayensis]SKA86051.1 tRNA (adenine22-N1)-methyltransferase [Caloramator quimbayensis]